MVQQAQVTLAAMAALASGMWKIVHRSRHTGARGASRHPGRATAAQQSLCPRRHHLALRGGRVYRRRFCRAALAGASSPGTFLERTLSHVTDYSLHDHWRWQRRARDGGTPRAHGFPGHAVQTARPSMSRPLSARGGIDLESYRRRAARFWLPGRRHLGHARSRAGTRCPDDRGAFIRARRRGAMPSLLTCTTDRSSFCIRAALAARSKSARP